MIRDCVEEDITAINEIINEAACAYRGVIPADCLHQPYMTRSELQSEIAAGVRFAGWDDAGTLAGIMGVQRVRDATLIRHAYVRTADQGRGIGGELLDWLLAQSSGPVLIGTWAAATWAIRFYERHGFHLVSAEAKDRLLGTYWTIGQRQREVSVVLVKTLREAGILSGTH
jgi:N-acetylglutamate synthase-like GNAT family acetyltransferase